MAEYDKRQQALNAYQLLCDTLDQRNWNYGKDEEKLVVHFGVNGDDLQIRLIIAVDEDREVIRVMSPLTFEMSEDKRMDGVIALNAINYELADGSFDYELSSGRIVFRMTSTLRDCRIDEALFQYLVDCTCAVVDEYNDQLLALDKGYLSLEDFLKKLQ